MQQQYACSQPQPNGIPNPQTLPTTVHCSPLSTYDSHTSPAANHQFQSNRTKILRYSHKLTAMFNPSESETLRHSPRIATHFDPIANKLSELPHVHRTAAHETQNSANKSVPPTDEMRHPNHNAYVTRLRFKMASPGNSLNNLKQHP